MSLFHNFIVLSLLKEPDAIMFSVGWHDVHRTTSETLIRGNYNSRYILHVDILTII